METITLVRELLVGRCPRSSMPTSWLWRGGLRRGSIIEDVELLETDLGVPEFKGASRRGFLVAGPADVDSRGAGGERASNAGRPITEEFPDKISPRGRFDPVLANVMGTSMLQLTTAFCNCEAAGRSTGSFSGIVIFFCFEAMISSG